MRFNLRRIGAYGEGVGWASVSRSDFRPGGVDLWFRDSREKVAYSCIQEKILHIGMPIGNSVRIARDRPVEIPSIIIPQPARFVNR